MRPMRRNVCHNPPRLRGGGCVPSAIGPVFLTDDQLALLTGYKRRQKQAETVVWVESR
jgi:hypothetical protein